MGTVMVHNTTQNSSDNLTLILIARILLSIEEKGGFRSSIRQISLVAAGLLQKYSTVTMWETVSP